MPETTTRNEYSRLAVHRVLRLLATLGMLFDLGAGAAMAQARAPSPFPVTFDQVPQGWTGPVFEPSFEFPRSLPAAEPAPWKSFDFRSQPTEYMYAVLAYILEGQNRTTWRLQDNPVRRWHHVPWMHPGKIGREFISGLTRELASRPGELGSGQTSCRQNWAVGFYNPVGGHTLHKVWGGGTAPPNVREAQFAPGTVVAKLLFTEATASEFAGLAGAPTIQGNINNGPELDAMGCVRDTNIRAPATLRLLQLDVGIRDERSESTGWVFGTFIFDGRRPGSDAWAKLTPIGLMWGNDPGLSDAAAATGTKPAESIVLTDAGLGRNFGRAGRMNGPVDNQHSSCLSCHMTGQYPSLVNGLAPASDLTEWADIKCWFRNLGPGQPFGTAKPCGQRVAASVSTDYSLQLAMGIRNYLIANPKVTLPVPGATAQPATPATLPAQRSPEALKTLIEKPYTTNRTRTYPIGRDERK